MAARSLNGGQKESVLLFARKQFTVFEKTVNCFFRGVFWHHFPDVRKMVVLVWNIVFLTSGKR